MHKVRSLRSQQIGLSLVELMVSVVLGLILSGAVIQAYLASRGVFRVQNAAAQLQENGRFAINYMTQDIRMTGFMGCPRINNLFSNSTTAIPSLYRNHLTGAVATTFGFTPATVLVGTNNVPSGNAWSAVTGTDVLVIRKASTTSARINNVTSGASIPLYTATNNPTFTVGDVFMVTDCMYADIVSANTVTTSGSDVTLTANAALSKSYGKDAEVLAFERIEYFVADTGRDTAAGNAINALYVRRYSKTADASTTPARYELIEGVRDMQLQYGEDTTGNDRAADVYRDANAVSNWANVVSVRINLLLQGTEDRVTGTSGGQVQSVSFMGSDVTSDGRLLQVFSSTAAVRGRLP